MQGEHAGLKVIKLLNELNSSEDVQWFSGRVLDF